MNHRQNIVIAHMATIIEVGDAYRNLRLKRKWCGISIFILDMAAIFNYKNELMITTLCRMSGALVF